MGSLAYLSCVIKNGPTPTPTLSRTSRFSVFASCSPRRWIRGIILGLLEEGEKWQAAARGMEYGWTEGESCIGVCGLGQPYLGFLERYISSGLAASREYT